MNGDMEEQIIKQFDSEIERLLRENKKAFAMITSINSQKKQTEGFGSGFFYKKNELPFLITAKHVAEDIKKNYYQEECDCFIYIAEKSIPITKMYIVCHENYDIAAIPLWDLKTQDYAHVIFFNNTDIVSFEDIPYKTIRYSAVGFIASRNRIRLRYEPFKAELQHITLFMNDEQEKNTPHIHFRLDPKQMYDKDYKPTILNIPKGMSGCPVVEVDNGNLDFPQINLVGMVISYKTKKLTAIRMDIIDDWLGYLFTRR